MLECEKPCLDCPIAYRRGGIEAISDVGLNGIIYLYDDGQMSVSKSYNSMNVFGGVSNGGYGEILNYTDYPELLREIRECDGPSKSQKGFFGKIGLGRIVCPVSESEAAENII